MKETKLTKLDEDGEYDLVASWLKVDRTRCAAGILAGFFAGVIAIVVMMIFAAAGGAMGGPMGEMDVWFPLKLIATPLLGSSATEIGMNLSPIMTGFLVFEALCSFLGLVYGHFIKTNSLFALLATGFVWGIFSWIFLWNLYFQSFKRIFDAQVSSGVVFPICIAFGLSLASIALFDHGLRGQKQK